MFHSLSGTWIPSFLVLAATAALCLPLPLPPALSAPDGSSPRPLDLPAAGSGSDEDAEEPAPEAILFYGAYYEGDGFFWCLDKSCSMSGGAIIQLKAEVTRAILSLSAQADLGLVAFSTNTIFWHSFPIVATPLHKQSAIAWVHGLEAAGSTVITPAGIRALDIAQASRKPRKTVIVVGDGLPMDDEAALRDITSANFEGTPVNTIFLIPQSRYPIPEWLIESGRAFMRELALANHGQFREVAPLGN